MPLIIWFDDGLVEHYTIAFPLMQSAGLKAVEAVITGYVGSTWPDRGIGIDGNPYQYRDKPCMRLDQLTELHNAGWDLVSHSATHPHFPLITQDQANMEFADSKSWLNSHGFEGYVFTWPFGEVTYQTLEQQYYSYERYSVSAVWDGKTRVIPLTVVVDHRNPIAPAVDNAISAAQTGYAIILFAHGIRTLTETRDSWEITPDECAAIINQISASNVEVKTLSEIVKSVTPAATCPYETVTRFPLFNQVLCRLWSRTQKK